MSVFLVDAAKPFSQGQSGRGLGYANKDSKTKGVEGGYVGVGLDVFGSFAGSVDTLAVRGSAGINQQDYPVLGTAPNLGLSGVGCADPSAASCTGWEYRHLRLLFTPTATAFKLDIMLSAGLAPGAKVTSLPTVLSLNLDGNISSRPDMLRVGLGASTGANDNNHHIRNFSVVGLSDASVVASVPPGTHSGNYFPGDPFAMAITATNNGPTPIGDAADNGIARVAQNMSGLLVDDIEWTCSATGGATCLTRGGKGSAIAEDWVAPPGGKVRLDITGKIGSAAKSVLTTAAVVPTKFDDNTLDLYSGLIQVDGGLFDTYLSNNTAAVSLPVRVPTTSVGLSGTAAARSGSAIAAGDLIDFSCVIKNSGEIDLKDTSFGVASFDGDGGNPTFDCVTIIPLSPADTAECKAEYRVTQSDIDRGSLLLDARTQAEPFFGAVTYPEVSARGLPR